MLGYQRSPRQRRPEKGPAEGLSASPCARPAAAAIAGVRRGLRKYEGGTRVAIRTNGLQGICPVVSETPPLR